MKKLLTLALCLFCATTFLTADEVETTEVATETKTEEVAAADESAAAEAKKEKAAESCCGK